MGTRFRNRLIITATALLALAGGELEATNGYLIHGVGSRAKALAGAGVACPQDALAAATNPAGMAFVDKRYAPSRADPWTWRLGYSTGDQPIPATEVLFNILAPGVMEEHITAGLSRKMGGGGLNLAFMYAPSVSVTGPIPLEVPGLQSITLEMDRFDLEIGYSWGF